MKILFRNLIILFNKRRQPRQLDRPHLYAKKNTNAPLLNLKPSSPLRSLEIYIRKSYIKFLRFIENDKKRKTLELSIAGVSLLTIFVAGGTFTAATADAPTILGDRTQFLIVPDYAPDIKISRDKIKVSYNPKTNEATYGPESSDFVNNRKGIVQYPFLRGVKLTDGFGPRKEVCEETCEETVMHQGQDFAAAEGAEIQAIADGTVLEVFNFKENTLNIEGQENGGGSFVKIQHQIDGINFVSIYAHLQYQSSPLTKGQNVKLGDLVGKVGNTGKSTGPHLHLGISVEGKDVDPIAFISQYNNRQWIP